jgi:hypothetical protein
MGLTGYHVHEKAILIPLILMGFISVQNYPEAELYLQVAMAGQLGLLPLLMNLKETGLKGEQIVDVFYLDSVGHTLLLY